MTRGLDSTKETEPRVSVPSGAVLRFYWSLLLSPVSFPFFTPWVRSLRPLIPRFPHSLIPGEPGDKVSRCLVVLFLFYTNFISMWPPKGTWWLPPLISTIGQLFRETRGESNTHCVPKILFKKKKSHVKSIEFKDIHFHPAVLGKCCCRSFVRVHPETGVCKFS